MRGEEGWLSAVLTEPRTEVRGPAGLSQRFGVVFSYAPAGLVRLLLFLPRVPLRFTLGYNPAATSRLICAEILRWKPEKPSRSREAAVKVANDLGRWDEVLAVARRRQLACRA